MRKVDKRLLLLGVLRVQKMHGYQLQQFLDQHADSIPSLKAPTAYYTLEGLAADGLVTVQSEREGNRPTRQVYCLTPRGEEEFLRLLRENLASYEIEDSADDVGVTFLGDLPAGRTAELLGQKRALIEEKLLACRAAVKAHPHGDSAYFALARRRLRLEADLKWIDGVIGSTLDGLKASRGR